MELRDLLIIDAESLSPSQAKMVVRDIIDVLAKGVSGEDQPPLRTLLIAAQEVATGQRVGVNPDTVRQEVLQKIQEAEARGDKRTARYLAESMAKRDMAAAEIEEHRIANPVQKYTDAQNTAANQLLSQNLQERIDVRTQELLRTRGSDFGYKIKLARKQAAAEMAGRPAYEDDINDEPVKPSRQAILDAHKGLR